MNYSNDTDLMDRLDDLATGQLGLIAAWRLRRQINCDPKLASEWATVSTLRTDLRKLSTDAPRRLPISPSPTYTIGDFTMKRRTAALAAGAVFLFTVSGAVAERYFVKPDVEVRFHAHGRELDDWLILGQFRGNVSLYDARGMLIEAARLEGSSPEESVEISYVDRGDPSHATGANPVHVTMKGFGRLAVHSRSGRSNGTLVLSALTAKDEHEIVQRAETLFQDYLDYYRRPERVDLSDAGLSFHESISLPHITGGVFYHDFDHNRESYGAVAGGSWKVIGDVKVEAQFYDARRSVEWPSWQWWSDDSKTWVEVPPFHFSLPAQTLVQSVSSKPVFTPLIPSVLTPAQQTELSNVYVPSANPKCSWVIADPVAGVDPNTGDWKHVLRSGTFNGYGRHIVNDEKGKPVMILDVSPLTPAKSAR